MNVRTAAAAHTSDADAPDLIARDQKCGEQDPQDDLDGGSRHCDLQLAKTAEKALNEFEIVG